MRKIAKNGPNMEVTQKCDGLRVPLSADHLNREMQVRAIWFVVSHAGGRTPAHCDASRISAGVLFRDSAPVLSRFFQFSHIFAQIFPQCSPTWKKFFPKPSQILSKSLEIPPKMDPEDSLEPILGSIMILLVFRRPKSYQKAAKRVQKTPQTVPNPSQMEPKTLPNPLFQ